MLCLDQSLTLSETDFSIPLSKSQDFLLQVLLRNYLNKLHTWDTWNSVTLRGRHSYFIISMHFELVLPYDALTLPNTPWHALTLYRMCCHTFSFIITPCHSLTIMYS